MIIAVVYLSIQYVEVVRYRKANLHLAEHKRTALGKAKFTN